jgi:DnaJ-class molecular chaperone
MDDKYGDCRDCHGFGVAYIGENGGRGKAGVLCPVCDGTGKAHQSTDSVSS